MVFQQNFAKRVSNSWFNPLKASPKTEQGKSQSPLPFVSSLFSRIVLLHAPVNRIDLTVPCFSPTVFPVCWQVSSSASEEPPQSRSLQVCCPSLVMAAQTLGYICLALHLNHIFLVLANHSQPSPGLDLFKPEGKLYLFLFKTAKKQEQTFKGFFFFFNSSSTP